MTEVLETINAVAQCVLSLVAVVGGVIAALAASRWGKGKVLSTAQTVTDILGEVARIAVAATEQKWRKTRMEASVDPEGVNRIKRDEALSRARELLPAGVEVDDQQLDSAIEAAVAAMNWSK